MPPLPCCAAADRLAVRFFFRDLSEEQAAAVQAHLAHCSRCRGKLQRFMEVWRRDGERRPREAATR